MDSNTCPLCGNGAESQRIPVQNRTGYVCPFCGRFSIHDDVSFDDIKYLLAGYLFEINHRADTGNPIILNKQSIQQILVSSLLPSNILDKIIKCLKYLSIETKYYGEEIEVPPVAMYAYNLEEAFDIVSDLDTQGLLHSSSTQGFLGASITFDGLFYVEKYQKELKTNQCFIAMWFNSETDDLWKKAIKPGCLAAGYNPVKIDLLPHNDNIVDKILAEIRRSLFLIADFTGQNRGVYYEAGFAKGLGKQVIQLCRKDYFEGSDREHKLHFDNTQVNTRLWEQGKEEELKEKIQFNIEANFGHGNHTEGSNRE